jgi:hypothetical protein
MRRAELGLAIVFASWPLLAAGQSGEPVTLPSTVPDIMPSTVPDTMPTTIPDTLPGAIPDTNPSTMPATSPDNTASTLAATLPSTIPDTNPTTEPTTEPSTEPATEPAATAPTSMPLESATTVPSTKPVADDPTTMPTLAGIKEGTVFPDRVGRLWRVPGSREIQFVFDVNGTPTRVPLLPNLELMRLENAVAQDGWDEKFHASGRITEYKGRNFVLLEHASRVGETESDAPAGDVR